MAKQNNSAKTAKNSTSEPLKKDHPKNVKPIKPKGQKPDFTPKAVRVHEQSFSERCFMASMCYDDMLNGVPGEYFMPITWNGEKRAGAIIIEPVAMPTDDAEGASYYGLKIVASSFYKLKSDDIWFLPVAYLRHYELRQRSQSDRLFTWQAELHCALRAMIPQAIAHHVQKNKVTHVAKSTVQAPACNNVVNIATFKDSKPEKIAESPLPFSEAMLTEDGLYKDEVSGVEVRSIQKRELPRIIRINLVPMDCDELKGMAGTYCYASDFCDENEHRIKNFKFVEWLRKQLVLQEKKAVA